MANDPHHFDNYKPYHVKDTIKIGDSAKLRIAHIGQKTLYTSTSDLILNNILVVPTLRYSLLSVCRFISDNFCSLNFDSWDFLVKDPRTQLLGPKVS